MRPRHFATLLLLALSLASATAETYYDLTEHYLTNSLFDGDYDYDVSQTGNVAQEMLSVNGWTNDYTMDYTIVGVYQVGTKKTYNNASIPATNVEGSAEGGVLALSTGWGCELKLYQRVTLPAGKYRIVSAYYNGDASKTAGMSLLGWIPDKGSAVMSAVNSFACGQWVEDVVSFTLTAETTGKIQVGFKAVTGQGSAAVAKISVDYVKLLSETPHNEGDIAVAPFVATDKRFARGATMAFGRLSVISNGMTVKERGFCCGKTPEPTIDDTRSSQVLNNNGEIYCLKNLTPATKYYMRAYAIMDNNEAYYGEAIKFYTIPMGNVTYWYNNTGDDAANKRVNQAATQACEIFSNLTSIQKHFAIGYRSGTPTADCNYKDDPWMNMGANADYQRTGTIMHEMQHGLGLVPYSTQWNKNNLRERLDGEGRGSGCWLGDRVSAFLDFWDNTTGSLLNGDYQHMWPYGINGAHEDNGTLVLYYGNAMIGQALGEDGLEHKSSTFADPYYSFDQEDDVKYYIKNESAERGLYSSYLMPNKSGSLQWVSMTAAEAVENDSTAWYITFTPNNQYYQLRNAATGQYLSYSGSAIKTATKTTLTANENWHLMKGRVDVDGQRGYWMIHPTGNWSPQCLQANTNGATTAATFNIANTAETQRWLIMTAEELKTIETKAVEQQKKVVDDMIAQVRQMAKTPYKEYVEGAGATLEEALAGIENRKEASANTVELSALATEAKTVGMDFLKCVTPVDASKPFDLTWLLVNPTVNDNIDGWTTTAGITALSFGCVEFYQKTFDFNQTVTGLPAGVYEFDAQAFQRPGKAEECSGKNITTSIYAGSASQAVAHAVSDAQSSKLGGNESEVNGQYIPNNMEAASIYFGENLYQNSVITKLPTDGGSLKVGLRCTSSSDYYWTIFDNFRLFYLGVPSTMEVTARSAGNKFWATFYSGMGNYELPTGTTAYTGTVEGETLVLHKLGSVIPQGCAVIIVSDTEGTLTLNRTSKSAIVEGGNDLQGVDVETTVAQYSGSVYVMGESGSVFGFHPYSDKEIPSSKAFLVLGSSSRMLNIVFDAETGISTISSVPNGKGRMYNLNGQQVDRPSRGVYVMDGKKLMIK